MATEQNTFTYFEEEYGDPAPWLSGQRPTRPVAISQSGIKISIFTWGGPEGGDWFEVVDTTTDYKKRFLFEELFEDGCLTKITISDAVAGAVPEDTKSILSIAIEGWPRFISKKAVQVFFC